MHGSWTKKSDTDTGVANFERLLRGIVGVATNEVLKEELRIGEITGIVLEALSVGTHEGLLEIGGEPNPFLHVLRVEEGLTFADKLVGAHLNVLVEKVAAENLLAILVVELVARNEQETEGSLGNELHVLVLEEDVVVVKENE